MCTQDFPNQIFNLQIRIVIRKGGKKARGEEESGSSTLGHACTVRLVILMMEPHWRGSGTSAGQILRPATAAASSFPKLYYEVFIPANKKTTIRTRRKSEMIIKKQSSARARTAVAKNKKNYKVVLIKEKKFDKQKQPLACVCFFENYTQTQTRCLHYNL